MNLESDFIILQALQECFEKKDIPMLQKILGEMPDDEARYYLKRCVDSGLWIPNAKDAPEAKAEEKTEGTEEETYEVPD